MKMQLDLGSANVMRAEEGFDCYGVDLVNHHNSERIRVADLALQAIPYESNLFDLVTAHDFIEHIPPVIYVPRIDFLGDQSSANHSALKARYCVIALFNELYRVLKHNGELFISVPLFPSQMAVQDPTHVSFWTLENFNYFSGDYYGFHDHYGHTSRFKKVTAGIANSHVQIVLRADKETPADAPYTV